MQVFPVAGGVPALRASAVVLATRGGLPALTPTSVEQNRDAPLPEEPDTGPKEEVGFVTGHDQEKSNVVGFVTIDRRPPRAEDLEHVRPADSTRVE